MASLAIADAIKKNLATVVSQIGEAQLLAVSKYSQVAEIRYALLAGQKDFAENRVADLLAKAQALLREEVQWHFIGALQKNKINNLFKVPNLTSIHSVDSLELWQALNQRAQQLTKPVGFFLQVNTSGETEKNGLHGLSELIPCLQQITESGDPHLPFMGLMTMGKLRTENFAEDAKKCFAQLQEMQKYILAHYPFPKVALSMGMSADFQWALEYGADYVRIGSAIFKANT